MLLSWDGRFPYFDEPFVRTKRGCFLYRRCFSRLPSHWNPPRSTGAIIMMGGLEFFRQGDLPEDSNGVRNVDVVAWVIIHKGYDPNELQHVSWSWMNLYESYDSWNICRSVLLRMYIIIYQIFDIFGWFWTCKPQQKAIGIPGLAMRKLS